MPYYFDYMAATPTDPAVNETMLSCMNDPTLFANPSATHTAGQQVQQHLQQASQAMLGQLNASENDKLIFTSGATEATNLALIGAANQYNRSGKHIVSTNIEHHATLNTLNALKKQGYSVTLLQADPQGIVALDSIKKAIQPDTVMLTIAHINNEIGVMQDIEAIAELCRDKGILLHIDAAQSIGKCAFDISKIGADLVSFSAHKCYGPKGVGALYIRHNRKITPILHGGTQQHQLRPGTVPLMLVLAMAKAWEVAANKLSYDTKVTTQLHHEIMSQLNQNITYHAHPTQRVMHNIMLSLPEYVTLDDTNALRDKFNISSSASCTEHVQSHVLAAIGVNTALQMRALRISLGRWSSSEDCQDLVHAINQLCAR